MWMMRLHTRWRHRLHRVLSPPLLVLMWTGVFGVILWSTAAQMSPMDGIVLNDIDNIEPGGRRYSNNIQSSKHEEVRNIGKQDDRQKLQQPEYQDIEKTVTDSDEIFFDYDSDDGGKECPFGSLSDILEDASSLATDADRRRWEAIAVDQLARRERFPVNSFGDDEEEDDNNGGDSSINGDNSSGKSNNGEDGDTYSKTNDDRSSNGDNSSGKSNNNDDTHEAAPLPLVAPSLVTEFRAAVDFALAHISVSVKNQNVKMCTFKGFTTDESELIWEQARRRRRVAGRCARYGASFRTYDGDIYDSVIWDTRSHLGYCPIFKTGSTSIMSHLLDWAGENSETLDDNQIHNRTRQLYPVLQGQRISTELSQHHPLLFTVVRHPFVRVVSAYLNRIEDGYRPISRKRWIRTVRGLSLYDILQEVQDIVIERAPRLEHSRLLTELLHVDNSTSNARDFQQVGDPYSTNAYMTFQEFVRFIIRENIICLNEVGCLREVDEHWQPQYVMCSPCSLHYDYIANMETFAEDSEFAIKILGRLPPSTTSEGNPPSRNQKDSDIPGTSNDTVPNGKFSFAHNHEQSSLKDTSETRQQYDVDRKNNFDSKKDIELLKQSNNKKATSGTKQQRKDKTKSNKTRRNSSMGANAIATAAGYIKTLSKNEIRLLYVAYYLDFTLFDYRLSDVLSPS